MRRSIVVLLGVILAACVADQTPSPFVSPQPGASQRPSPVGPSITPSPIPSSPYEIPRLREGPDFAGRVIPAFSAWSGGELFLLAGFRNDIRPRYTDEGCSPRRADLPPGASHGVDCELADGPVERVGAYLFPDDPSAQAAYEGRLAEYGLGPQDAGGCPFSERGDILPRSACFVNEFGRANLRLYWPGQSVVLGALGRRGDVQELADWLAGPVDGDPGALANQPLFRGPWLGSLGGSMSFQRCERPAPERVQAASSFTYEGDGIWLTDPSAETLRQLTDRGQESTWSPDGRSLAYVSYGDQGFAGVRVVDPDTGDDRPLTLPPVEIPSLNEGPPSLLWSSDSSRLAFTGWTYTSGSDSQSAHPSVWVTPVEGGESRWLADGVLLGWSPDGTRVLVRLAARDETYSQETRPIAVIDARVGGHSLLGRGSSAEWSSDCRFVVLQTVDRQPSMVVLEGTGTRPRVVVEGWSNGWSPVSDELLFRATDDAIWVVPAAGGSGRNLAEGISGTWSQDGSQVAIVSERNGLSVMNADGSGGRVIAGPEYPMGLLGWSPDGRHIVSYHEFTGDTCSGPMYGFVIATDGSGVRRLAGELHAGWRPVEPPKPAGELTADPPPKPSQGCGG